MGGVYTVLNVFGVYDIIGGLNSRCQFILYIYIYIYYILEFSSKQKMQHQNNI